MGSFKNYITVGLCMEIWYKYNLNWFKFDKQGFLNDILNEIVE